MHPGEADVACRNAGGISLRVWDFLYGCLSACVYNLAQFWDEHHRNHPHHLGWRRMQHGAAAAATIVLLTTATVAATLIYMSKHVRQLENYRKPLGLGPT